MGSERSLCAGDFAEIRLLSIVAMSWTDLSLRSNIFGRPFRVGIFIIRERKKKKVDGRERMLKTMK
jgi:hypothetical protein